MPEMKQLVKIQALWAVLCGAKCTNFGRCKTCKPFDMQTQKSTLEPLSSMCFQKVASYVWTIPAELFFLFFFFFLKLPYGVKQSTSINRAGRVKWLFAVCGQTQSWPELQLWLWCYWHKREQQKDHPRAQMLFSTYRVTPQTSVN